MSRQMEARDELNRRRREGEIDLPTYEYLRGLLDGVKAFAFWKDGKEFVGTSGNELNSVFEKIVGKPTDPNDSLFDLPKATDDLKTLT